VSFVRNSYDAWMMLKDHISFQQEEVWCLALNSECGFLGKTLIFRGTVDHCIFHSRDVFRFLISCNASQFVLAHSHPSQNTKPSLEDIEVTKELFDISILIEIPLVDHLILSRSSYFSFRQKGFFTFNRQFGR